jgi:hypothetical protein
MERTKRQEAVRVGAGSEFFGAQQHVDHVQKNGHRQDKKQGEHGLVDFDGTKVQPMLRVKSKGFGPRDKDFVKMFFQ